MGERDPRQTEATLGAPALPGAAEASTLPTPAGGAQALAGGPGDPATRAALTPEAPGRYQLLREFGRGGQSVVLLAYDAHVGREVAFKQLLPERRAEGASSSIGDRFLREARITGQLEHPGIVPVHEVGRRPDGSLYYTQKLVRGRTLRAALESCATLEERLRLLPHLLAVCQAIAYAHGRGVIHRDLKPENVMVGEFGETVVLDWGLARSRKAPAEDAPAPERPVESLLDAGTERTLQGARLGTPAYMSPEQALGDVAAVDERSDVWSLGVVLFELLAGRRPFTGASVSEVMRQVATGEVPRVRALCPQAPAELAAIAQRALSRDPQQRYRDAAALAAELAAWFSGGKVGAYAYSALELLRRFVSRHRWQVVAALLAVLAVAGPLGYSATSAVVRVRRAAGLRSAWAEADGRVRALDLQLADAALDRAAADALERSLRDWSAQAARLRTLAEESGAELEVSALEQRLHPLLRSLDADAYAIPPAFLAAVQGHLEALARDPARSREDWRRRQAIWPFVQREFAARGLPEAMGFIGWIESRFRPEALSSAGARGVWQLMPATARQYGLRVDPDWKTGGADERTDPAKATTVAARYLANLLNEFGSDAFLLALASYNTGESKIHRLLADVAARPGGFRREERDFWRLVRLRILPDPIRDYCAELLAIAVAAREPARWGLE